MKLLEWKLKGFLFQKHIKKDNILTEEDENHYRVTNIFRFCEKILYLLKSNHCLLTGKYRGSAHSNFIINVTQKQSNFIPFIFKNFRKYNFLHLLKSFLIE